jgi:hypothetical protein
MKRNPDTLDAMQDTARNLGKCSVEKGFQLVEPEDAFPYRSAAGFELSKRIARATWIGAMVEYRCSFWGIGKGIGDWRNDAKMPMKK